MVDDIVSLDEPEPGPCAHPRARIVSEDMEAWCPECGSFGILEAPSTREAPNIVAQLATVRSVASFLSEQLQGTQAALLLAEAGMDSRNFRPCLDCRDCRLCGACAARVAGKPNP